MLEEVFNEPPHVTTYGEWGKAAVLIRTNHLEESVPNLNIPFSQKLEEQPEGRGYSLPILGTGRLSNDFQGDFSQDDWPFIYL